MGVPGSAIHDNDRVSRRRYERVLKAREYAEQMLEEKSRELFEANERLRNQAGSLEKTVAERTADLEKARQQAEAANEAKSIFLASMSHEIRTPLNGVLGMASVLQESELTAEQQDMLAIIKDSGGLLLGVINDILDLSKVEAGRLELEQVTVSLEQIFKGLARQYALNAQDKGLGFEVEVDPGARIWVQTDPIRLRQVIGNLISNAIKFTDGGQVTVRASAVPVANGWRTLVVEVRDTGIGLSDKEIGRLFKPFSQANTSITRKYGGTGLGLSISRQICQLMGGDIHVTSIQGAGSCFVARFELRSGVAPAQEGGEQEDIWLRQSAPLRVLVAEDNATNRTVLKSLLKKYPLTLKMTEDGAAALEAWQAEEFDLVLMDVNMPIMDGLTTTRMIRQEEAETQRRRTPILGMSANAMSHQVRQYEAEGMDGHVAKPMRRAEIVAGMRQLLCPEASGNRGSL